MKLSVATGNKGKFIEYVERLSSMGIECNMKSINYPEIQADTLEEVLTYALEVVEMDNFIMDDSGLFIDALNGFPGVYSAYVFKTIGMDGILKLMDGFDNRKAVFRTVIAGKINGKEFMVKGECHGHITEKEHGEKGFGYDPIFIPDGYSKTFAEMDVKEKNTISHRGEAINELVKIIKNMELK